MQCTSSLAAAVSSCPWCACQVHGPCLLRGFGRGKLKTLSSGSIFQPHPEFEALLDLFWRGLWSTVDFVAFACSRQYCAFAFLGGASLMRNTFGQVVELLSTQILRPGGYLMTECICMWTGPCRPSGTQDMFCELEWRPGLTHCKHWMAYASRAFLITPLGFCRLTCYLLCWLLRWCLVRVASGCWLVGDAGIDLPL